MFEVKKALLKVKSSLTGKSFDHIGFYPVMWQHLGPLALNSLANLFNLCLIQSVWPWSESEVIFLRKCGKPSYAKSGAYRSICISSYTGKLLEKIMCFRLEDHLKSCGVIDVNQEGF